VHRQTNAQKNNQFHNSFVFQHSYYIFLVNSHLFFYIYDCKKKQQSIYPKEKTPILRFVSVRNYITKGY